MTRGKSKKQLLYEIHKAADDLGMDETAYRELLKRVTGQDSCKGASLAKLNAVATEMYRKGWQGLPPRALKVAREAQPTYNKIRAVLLDNNLPWNYAHAIGQNMFGAKKVESLTWEQMQAVLVALMKKAETVKKAAV